LVAQLGFAANTNGQTGQTVVFLGFCPWQGRRQKPIVCPTLARIVAVREETKI